MRLAVLAFLAAVAVAACGKAAPPVSPEVKLPATISDLRGVVEDGSIALAWTNPQRRADSSRLRDLTEVRLYRTEDDGVMPPKPALLAQGRIVGYREIAAISLASPAPAVVRGHTVRFVDREGLSYGRRYTYVAIAEDTRGRVSLPSNRAAIAYVAPPEAPAAPTAEAGDGEVRLSWRPPARLRDGSAPGSLAYEVLRGIGAEGALETVFPVPAGQTEYVDRQVENERTYFYAVRAIRRDPEVTARGEASPRVAATPGRTKPPAAPANLTAALAAGAVRLAWSPSPDANVAGYIVYRATGGGERIRVGSVRAPGTTFTDRDVTPGTYGYVVTAQDNTARANESAPSNEVRLTVP
jgi:fibronectin type 3 domain-containing protein